MSAKPKAQPSEPTAVAATLAALQPVNLRDRRLIVPATEKGGQGKSTMMVHVAEWLFKQHPELNIALFDPCVLFGTMFKTFGPSGGRPLAALPVPPGAGRRTITRVDPTDHAIGLRALDPAINAITENDVVIIDGVGGQFSSGFAEWARGLGGMEIVSEDFNFRLTYVLCMTEEPGTVRDAQALMGQHGTGADYLIFRVEKDKPFLPWDMEEAAPVRELAANLNAVVVTAEKWDLEIATLLRGGAAPDSLTTLVGVAENLPRYGYHSCRRAMRMWHDFCHGQPERANHRAYRGLNDAASVLLPPALLHRASAAP